MSQIQYVIGALHRMRGRWNEVSRRSGVSRRSIGYIVRGRDSRVSTVEALATALREMEMAEQVSRAADTREVI